MKPKKTLVILANDENARFLLNAGIGKGLEDISEIKLSDVGAEVPEFSDQPGRSRAAPGMARHGLAPHGEPEVEERLRFAHAVVDKARAQWSRGGFDRIVLGAVPKMLGQLRELLPAEMTAAVVAEVSKDLLKIPARDLPKRFEDKILF